MLARARASTEPRPRCRGLSRPDPWGASIYDSLQRSLGRDAEDCSPGRASRHRSKDASTEPRPRCRGLVIRPPRGTSTSRWLRRSSASMPRIVGLRKQHSSACAASTEPRPRCRGSLPTHIDEARVHASTEPRPRCRGLDSALRQSLTSRASTEPRPRCRGLSPPADMASTPTSSLQRSLGRDAEDCDRLKGGPILSPRFNGASASMPRIVGTIRLRCLRWHRLQRSLGLDAEDCRASHGQRELLPPASTEPRQRCRGLDVVPRRTRASEVRASTEPRQRCRGVAARAPLLSRGAAYFQRSLGLDAEDRAPKIVPPGLGPTM